MIGKRFHIFYVIFILMIGFSCRKVIHIPVSDTTPKLVIDAFYDANNQEVRVKISETKNVFTSDTSFQGISGAFIEILDENGNVSPLNDLGNGMYSLENYAPTYDQPYTLKVLLDNVLYTATDSLKNVVPLDSLVVEYQQASLFMEEGFMLTFHFTDPEGPNFYRMIQNVNNEYLTDLGEQFLFTEGFQDGKPREIPFFWKMFEHEDTVKLEMRSYSEKSYRYYSEMYDLLGGTDFMAAPANPKAFWESKDKNALECLGHFTVYGYAVDSVIIGK